MQDFAKDKYHKIYEDSSSKKYKPIPNKKVVKAYVRGEVLKCSRSGVVIFQFLGLNFTSHHKRKSVYGLDNPTWEIVPSSILDKLKRIIYLKYKLL